jgi:hypothetical protein
MFTLALAAASTSACSTETASGPAPDEPTAKTDQALITATGDIMAWPLAPIAWDGLNATWPIAIWSPATIGALAFDVAGMTGLGLSVVGYPAFSALPITSAYLNAFIPTAGTAGLWGTPFFGTAGLYAPAYGYAGAYNPVGLAGGYGFGAYGALGGLNGTFLNGAWNAGLGLLNPALTSSALMFTNMATLNAFTPYTINVTFAAQTAAQQTALIASSAALSTASLSIFATPILPGALAATASIPFMSMIYPIMPLPLTAPLLGTAATTAALL